jgi:hypothetical protein
VHSNSGKMAKERIPYSFALMGQDQDMGVTYLKFGKRAHRDL